MEDDETPAFDMEAEWGFPFDPELNLEHVAPDQRSTPACSWSGSRESETGLEGLARVAGMQAATVVV